MSNNSAFSSTPQKPSLFTNTSSTQNNQGFSLGGGFGQKSGDSKPAFSFGSKADSGSDNASKPAFSFGQSHTASKPSFGLGGNKEESKPAFSFGGNKEEPKSSFSLGQNKEETKPGFSFGVNKEASKSGFSFGKKEEASKSELSLGGNKEEAPKSGFSLGGNKEDAPKTGFSFGGNKGASGFSLGGTKEAAKSGFSIGGNKEASNTGFSFGKKEEASNSGFSLGGNKEAPKSGFSIGGNKEVPKSGFSLGGNKEAPKSGFSLGGNKDAAKPSFSLGGDKKEERKPGFSFGQKKDESKPASDASKSATSLTFGSKKEDADKTKSFAPAGTTKEVTITPDPVSLENQTVQDLIKNWASKLTQCQSFFDSYSNAINKWDGVLNENFEKLSKLYLDVLESEQLSTLIDQNLIYLEKQQDDIEQFLDHYDNKINDIYEQDESILINNSNDLVSQTGNGAGKLANDKKREIVYSNAITLDKNLDLLSSDFASLISEINDVNELFNSTIYKNSMGDKKGRGESENDIYSIVKLMNIHLNSLKWLESNGDVLKKKVELYKSV